MTSLAPGDAANDGAWRGLPPVTAVNLTRALAPGAGATVLLEAPGVLVDGRPAPLVAVREVGEGARSPSRPTPPGDGASSRRRRARNRAYLRFWNQALRWLVRDPGLAPLHVEPDAPAVEPGAPVGLAVTARRPDCRDPRPATA